MDDPTRRCENDTDNGTRLSGLLFPSKGPIFLFGGAAIFGCSLSCFGRKP
jgi:hypothetical protein